MQQPAKLSDPLARIATKNLDAGIRAEMLALLAHPNFARAARQYRILYDDQVAQRSHMAVISNTKLLSIYLMINYFHGLRKISRAKRTGAIDTIKSHLEQADVSSGRTVPSMISRLVDMGQIVREANPADNRIKWLIPTPAMREFCKNASLFAVQPLALLDTPASHIDFWMRDHNVQEDMFFYFSQDWLKGNNPLAVFPALNKIMKQQQGIAVVNDLLLRITHEDGTIDASTPVPLSPHQLSARYRISRTHTRNILLSLERDGHIAIEHQNRLIMINPDLAVLDDCVAAMLLVVYRGALERAIAKPLSGISTEPVLRDTPLQDQ